MGVTSLHESTDHEEFTFINGLGITGLLMMQLGYPIQTVNISAKILLLVSGISMYLLFMYYTADLTTLMTAGSGMVPVRNFEDVIKGDYKVIVMKGAAQYGELMNAIPGTAKNNYFHNEMKGNPKATVSGLKEALKRMNEDEKTLFFYTLTARFITDELKFMNAEVCRTRDQL